jgi:hypothetical protein
MPINPDMEANIFVTKALLSLENGIFSEEFRDLYNTLEMFKKLIIHKDSEIEKQYKEAKEELEKEHKDGEKTIFQEQEKAKRIAFKAKVNVLHLFDDVEDDEAVMNGNKLLTNVIVESYNYGMKKIQKYTNVTNVSFERKLDELHLWHMEDTFGCEGYFDDEFSAIKRLRKNFYNSMVLSIHTTIKKHLNRMCKSIIIRDETSENTHYVYTSNVEDAISYIKTYGRVSFDSQDEVFLCELKEICNLIAEEDGDLCNKTDTEKLKIRNMALNVPIEQIEVCDAETNEPKKTDKCIDLNPEFVKSCLQRGEHIVGKVIGQVIAGLDEAISSASS